MASPAVAAVVEGGLTANGTNLAVTLPGGGAATDEYIVIIAKGSVSCTINALANWTEILDEAVASGLAVIRYTGTGVPSNPTFVQSVASRSVWCAYRITGADKSITPEIGTTATGTSTTPDPPSRAVTGGPKDILALAFFSMTGAVEVADTDVLVTTFPSNYTSGQVEKTGGTGGTNLSGGLGAAARQVSATSSENPGTFTQNASRGWRANTLVIHPVVPKQTSVGRMSLAAHPSTPAAQIAHSFKLRARVTGGAGELIIALYEGANNRSGNRASGLLSGTLVDYDIPIADANAELITDYSDLEIRWYGYCADGSTATFEIDQLRLNLPDEAPTGGGTEFTDSGTIYVDITPSSVEVFEGVDSNTVPLVLTASATEFREITDANTIYVDLQLSSTENRESTDAATAYLDIQPSSTDAADYVDTNTVRLTITLSATEARESTDANTVTVVLTPSGVEVHGRELTDSGTIYVDLQPSGVEARESTDATTVSLALTVSSTDVAERVDAATVNVVLTPSATEIREISDSGTVYVDLNASGTDLLSTVDTATVPLSITPSGIEFRETTDAATITLALTPSSTEARESTDAATIAYSITPSGVDDHTSASGFTDAGTINFVLTPSATDLRESTDSATATLTITPSSTDTREVSDAATIYVDVTPSGTEQREVTDASTIPVTLTPNGTESREVSDSNTIYYDLQPSGVDDHTLASGYVDSGTVPLVITPSSTSTLQSIDSATTVVVLTVSADEFRVGFGNEDEGLVYVRITPGTLSEFISYFDALLVGTLSRHWSGTIAGTRFSGSMGDRRWSATFTSHWSAKIGNVRFSAALAGNRWAASLSKRWAGVIGRK